MPLYLGMVKWRTTILFVLLPVCLAFNPIRAKAEVRSGSGRYVITAKVGSAITLSDHVLFMLDSGERLELGDFLRIPDSNLTDRQVGASAKVLSKGRWWCKIELVNSTESLVRYQPFYCENAPAVSTYIGTDSTWTSKRVTGLFSTSVERKTADLIGRPMIEIPPRDSVKIVYVVHSLGTGSILHPSELILTNSYRFWSTSTAETIFLGIVYGILALMLVFSITLYIMLRDDSFLYFAFVLLSILIYFFISNQFLHRMTALHETFSWYASSTFGTIITISFTLLFNKLIKLRDDFRPVYWLLWSLSFVMLFWIIRSLVLPSNEIDPRPLNYSIFVWIIVSFIGLTYATIKGKKDAGMLVVSTLFMVVGVCFYLLAINGVIAVSFLTAHGFQIGAVVFCASIMVTLWRRVKRIQLEMIRTEKALTKSAQEKEEIVRNQNVHLERTVKERTAELSKEKEASEKLLLNILPATIAEELKEKGRADARDFEKVTVLFSDFKGFTAASENLSAQDLVGEINACFEAFDGTMGKYNIEKIKTIGDAYMAAGGLPVPSEDSVKNTVLAALELQEFIVNRKEELDKAGRPAFQMRIGIHTGPVVAGIVGVKKFQYDVWGDTVNTASRMESSGVVGKVNISQETYDLIRDDPDFTFESRGKIQAKGKGEIEMWFVEKAQK